jgi:hypothetical protein
MVNDGRYPQAVRDGIAVQEMAEDLLIFDTRVQRAHSLNATAKAVWEVCDGKHSPTQLAEGLGLDRDAVMLALQSLSACDLLEHPVSSERVVSRREVLRRLAFAGAAAAAVPVIRSVAVPTAAHAASLCTKGSCPSRQFCGSQQTCRAGSSLDSGSSCGVGANSCGVGSVCSNRDDSSRCVPLR